MMQIFPNVCELKFVSETSRKTYIFLTNKKIHHQNGEIGLFSHLSLKSSTFDNNSWMKVPSWKSRGLMKKFKPQTGAKSDQH